MRKNALLFLAIMTLVAGLAAPVEARGRFALWDCMVQNTMFQIPSQQAQAHLPRGFAIGAGPAGNSQLANAYVESWACGADPKNPNVVAAFVYVPVNPPQTHAREQSSHRFILAASIGGYDAKKLATQLCATDLFVGGNIDVSNRQQTVDTFGASIGTTNVASEALSLEMTVGGGGYTSQMSLASRMFYEAGDRIGSFDLTWKNEFLSLGPGHVTFTQPLLDFPSEAAGLGQHSRIWLSLNPRCSKDGPPKMHP